MSCGDWFQAVGSIATALGVCVALWALAGAKRLAQTQFEDSLTAQYRQLIERLPLDALLGKELTDKQMSEALKTFYLYFDLSNEQALLYKQKRINKETWKNWHDGIKQNLEREAFKQAWRQLCPDLESSFDDLKAAFSSSLVSPA